MSGAATIIITTDPPEFPDGPESEEAVLWGEAQAIGHDVIANVLDADPDGLAALAVAVPLYDWAGINTAIVAMKLDRPYTQQS